MKRSHLSALAIAGVVFLWLASGLIGGDPAPSPEKTAKPSEDAALIQVRTRDMTAEKQASQLIVFGRTEAARTVALRAETAGRVAAIPLDKGVAAKKGEVIVRLTPDDRPARLKEANAAVEHAKLAYEAARKLSKKAFRSKVQLAENKAQLEAARARRASIRTEISQTEIRAPFAGVVNDVTVEVGDYLKIGDATATVIELDPMLVVAEIAERNIGRFRLGGSAWAHVTGLGSFDGTVSFISRTATPSTRTFRVEVSVLNPDGRIGEGMTTEMRLDLETVLAHRISPAVLTLSDEGIVGVKTVNADDMVEFHPIRIISDAPAGMWVGGLPDHIRAVTVGQEFVKVGQKVQPVPEKISSDKASSDKRGAN
ncbi:MAG: efflux RND transporter periplasmic adaptor subunit [Rhodospirillales bacterium]|nr:efflux RND transporter periplasmic adaptor subunit [Alphaproteobacteria bacterium]MBL6947622.1 efflux RND transporter periplasmic adaptor subunit [Rhodospirillales bacterium]